MALTDEQEATLKADLAAKETQLKSLLEQTKQQQNEAKEAEAKRSKEKPGAVTIDPDVVKEVAQLKEEVANLKKRLGDGGAGGYKLVNFFGE